MQSLLWISGLVVCLALAASSNAGSEEDRDPPVKLWELLDLAEIARTGGDQPYREFLNVPSMTAGFYRLEREATDTQTAHDRDELYHVIAGRATLRIADADHPVQPGSVVFVRRGVEHRFHEISEPLELLVVFAGDRR